MMIRHPFCTGFPLNAGFASLLNSVLSAGVATMLTGCGLLAFEKFLKLTVPNALWTSLVENAEVQKPKYGNRSTEMGNESLSASSALY